MNIAFALLAPLLAASSTKTSWAGINAPYLYACNATVRGEALDAVRAAGIKVVRVFVLSTAGINERGSGCAAGSVRDVEPDMVGVWDDTVLARLDDLLHEAALRGLKLSVALHDRWSLGCTRNDAYARKYGLDGGVNCSREANPNNATRFYVEGRADFARRIAHILGYVSRHSGLPLGQWSDALFAVDAENEALGGITLSAAVDGWLCSASAAVRAALHPRILVASGGGGVGTATGAAELAVVQRLARCSAVDIIALHSDAAPAQLDTQLTGYLRAVAGGGGAPASARVVLQEWRASGANSTAQAAAFSARADVALAHRVPQFFWSLQPGLNVQIPSTARCCVSPPGPAPSPGEQRTRGADGVGWVNRCTATSCPTEVWVTAVYPAAQRAALQRAAADWPEVWECVRDADCRFNGRCTAGACVCSAAWRGPTCAALRFAPAPRSGGFRHANASSWGGSIVHDLRFVVIYLLEKFFCLPGFAHSFVCTFFCFHSNVSIPATDSTTCSRVSSLSTAV